MLMLSDFEDSDSDENYTKKRKIDETIQGNKTNFATDEIQPVYDSADFPLCKGLPRARFDIIYADPPFEYTRKVGSGVANNHYGLMTDTQLMAMGEEINLITTKDSALFMWCSGPTFNRALRLITAWGFTYKTVAFNWIKTAVHDATKPCMMGLGSYSRPGSEFVLVAVKGKFVQRIDKKKRPDQVFLGPRTSHSVKPTEVRDRIIGKTGFFDKKGAWVQKSFFPNDKLSINSWIVKEGLNKYGDAKDTVYEDGPSPLCNVSTQKVGKNGKRRNAIELLDYVRSRHPHAPWEDDKKCTRGLELFCRGSANAHWAVWGDQTGKF